MATPKKLTKQHVLAIRKEAAAGYNRKGLASKYKVSTNTIGQIITGRLHKDAGGPIQEARRKKAKAGTGTRKKAGTGTRKKAKKRQTRRRRNATLTDPSLGQAIQILQTIGKEWPRVRQAFLAVDEIVNGNG